MPGFNKMLHAHIAVFGTSLQSTTESQKGAELATELVRYSQRLTTDMRERSEVMNFRPSYTNKRKR
jgi:hypothetical protein